MSSKKEFDYKHYLLRSKNELALSNLLLKLSVNMDLQLVEHPQTFYSQTIIHSYYSIFYAAKSYLMKKHITTDSPNVHKKTFDEFRQLTDKGIIDVELLKMYKQMLMKADSLLEIFRTEKGKRGKFTYQKLAQANKKPATESVNNAGVFFKHIYNLCE